MTKFNTLGTILRLILFCSILSADIVVGDSAAAPKVVSVNLPQNLGCNQQSSASITIQNSGQDGMVQISGSSQEVVILGLQQTIFVSAGNFQTVNFDIYGSSISCKNGQYSIIVQVCGHGEFSQASCDSKTGTGSIAYSNTTSSGSNDFPWFWLIIVVGVFALLYYLMKVRAKNLQSIDAPNVGFCNKCGQKMKPGSKFCPSCGAKSK